MLVVEDDDDVRAMLMLALQTYGYAAIPAAGGEEALRRIHARPRPAVAMIDLMMPGMSGEQLVEAIRADPAAKGLPIVLLSGSSALDDKARALAVEGHLSKPVDIDRLLQVVAAYSRPQAHP